MTPAADPNFPSNLDIHPLHLAGTACAGANGESDAHGQTSAIAKYGIAGRVWEASAGLLAYLTPGGRGVPACSLFSDPDAPGSSSSCPARILELGSGQALASLHLAARLPPRDTVVLTDLPNVIPLCNQSVDVWSTAGEGKEGAHARVVVQPLAWGEDAAHLSEFGPFTHVLMCDLVYFPHLYPPLLRTLLEITEPTAPIDPDQDVFGPEIILAWKSRSLGLEESFFDSFSRYFRSEPVTDGSWDDEVKIFLCRRWRVTDAWVLPEMKHVMAGARGAVQGRSYDLVDSLFSAIEW